MDYAMIQYLLNISGLLEHWFPGYNSQNTIQETITEMSGPNLHGILYVLILLD